MANGYPTPNPGSDAAREAGCFCPVLDNNRGRFPVMANEDLANFPRGMWWIVSGCPLHDGTPWQHEEARP